VIDVISKRGAELGDKSLEVTGVNAISNGGPGYYPPEAPRPPPAGVKDDIDIAQVRFYTRTGRDITSEMRTWPIDSQLTPRFSRGDVVFEHTAQGACDASRERQPGCWPGEKVNALAWVVFRQAGQWKAFSIDYLRPNQPRKTWADVNQVNEPRTGWEARSGETLFLMVSRLDPRLAQFPRVKSRSTLVRVTAP
jgi:hypothetical protein